MSGLDDLINSAKKRRDDEIEQHNRTGTSAVNPQQATQDILSGQANLTDYNRYQAQQVQNYWQNDPKAFASGLSPTQALLLQRQQQAQAAKEDFSQRNWFKPIEWAGAKINWVYSKTISPAASFVGLSARHVVQGYAPGEDMGWGGYQETWDQAHHVSPGQSLWLIGKSNEDLLKAGFHPTQLNAGTGNYLGPVGGEDAQFKKQQDIAAKAEKVKNAYFSGGTQKWISGTSDFAVSWYLDPLVVAGKGAGAARAAALSRPVRATNKLSERAAQLPEKLTENAAALKAQRVAPLPAGTARPLTKAQALQEAQAAAQVSKPGGVALLRSAWRDTKYGGLKPGILESQTVQNMADYVQSVKDTYGAARGAAILRSSMQTFNRGSADGESLIQGLMAARSRDELLDTLKISIGDQARLSQMASRNAEVFEHLRQGRNEFAPIANNYYALPEGARQSPLGKLLKQDMDNAQAKIDNLEDQFKTYSTIMNTQNKLRELHFNQWTTPKAVAAREVLKGNEAVTGILSSKLIAPVKWAYGTWNNIRPTGYIDVHDLNSHRDIDATLAQTPLSAAERQSWVGRYINAKPEARGDLLLRMEADVTSKLAAKYGVDDKVAKALYEKYVGSRGSYQTSVRSYSTGTIDDPNVAGQKINLSHIDSDGAGVVAHPILTSQILNSHVLMKFDAMEKVLKNHGKDLEKIMKGSDAISAARQIGDVVDSYWKFATLFRIGYPIRSVSDDLLGQAARFGAMNLALRASKGVFRSKWVRGVMGRDAKESDLATAAIIDAHVNDLTEQLKGVERGIAKRRAKAANVQTTPAQRRKLLRDADDAEVRRDAMLAEINDARVQSQSLTDKHALTLEQQVFSGGQMFPAPYEGIEGQIFQGLNGGARNTANMLGRPADWFLKEHRSGNWTVINAVGNEEAHMQAWLRDINNQIANDELAKLALKGASVDEMTRWLRSQDGLEHMSNLGLRNMAKEELAARVKAHVDHYLPTNHPGMDQVRLKALTGEVTGDMLKRVVPKLEHRPEVNSELLAYATGHNALVQFIDKQITNFYKVTNEIPAQYLLKNPLFAQLYRGSLREQMAIAKSQGVTHLTEEMRRRLTTTARQEALQGVKRFTFNMDHETKLQHQLKFAAAFVGAQQESFNRWARIFAERPEQLGRGALLYGSPMRTGMATDRDGDPIVNGYAIKHVRDPKTGEIVEKKVLASRANILIQVPEYLGGKALAKAFGGDGKTGVKVPLSTLNFTLPNPPEGEGTTAPIPVVSDIVSLASGPYVQIAANQVVKWTGKEGDLPKRADFAQRLGFVPFGVTDNPLAQAVPGWLKAAAIGEDSDQYQGWLWSAMQNEDYRYHTGQRKKPATWEELKKQADQMYLINIMSKQSGFGLKADNPYQFYIDEQQRMKDVYGPQEGQQKFVEKYGPSVSIFAESRSKNNIGITPTQEGYKVFGELRGAIDNLSDPKLASFLIGDEGEGTYSEGAYRAFQQTSLQTGSSQKVIEKQSAFEAAKQANVDLGWQRYNSEVQKLDSQLFAAGFTSYDAPGAEPLKARKDAIVAALTSPKRPDGTDNEFYNEDFAAEYSQLDPEAYTRRAADIEKALQNPAIQKRAYNSDGSYARSDLISMMKYISMRNQVTQILSQRKSLGGSDDIEAAQNLDLRRLVAINVDSLKEQDTKFGYLHARWFSNDLGYGLTNKERQVLQAQQNISSQGGVISEQ